MNSYPYNSTAINQPHFNPYGQRSQSSINPSLLQSDNNATPTNPQQNLINANMNAIGTLNPAAMMNGAMNPTSNTHQMSGMQQPTDPAMMQQFQQLQSNTMSPQDFQIAQQKMFAQRQAQQHYMVSNPAMNMSQYPGQHQSQHVPQSQQQQQQQQQQSPSTYYSPSSMGPPQQIPARPQTAMSMQMPTPQSMQPSSRPPTATSHSRPGTAGSIPSQAMAGPSGLYAVTPQQQGQGQGGNNRPPSRPQTAGSSHSASGTGSYQMQQQPQTSPVGGQFNVGMNGFPQQQQQQQQHGNYGQMPQSQSQPQSQNQMHQPSPTTGPMNMNMNMNGGSMQHNQQQQLHNQAQAQQQQPPMNVNLTGSPYLGAKRKSIQDGNMIGAMGGQQQQQMSTTSPQISQTGRMAASASGAGPGQIFNTNTNQPGLMAQHNMGMGINAGMGGMHAGSGGQMDSNAGLGLGLGMTAGPGMMATQQNMPRQMPAGPGDMNRQQQQQQLDQNIVQGQPDMGQQQHRPGIPPGYVTTGPGSLIDGITSTPAMVQARSSQMQQQQQHQRVQSRGPHPGMGGGMNMSPASYGPIGGVGMPSMGNSSQLIGSPVSAGGLHPQSGQHPLQQHQQPHASNPMAISMQPNLAIGIGNTGVPGGGMQMSSPANMGGLSPIQLQQMQERKMAMNAAQLQQQNQLQRSQMQQQHIQQIKPGTPTAMVPRTAGPSSAGGLLPSQNGPAGHVGMIGGLDDAISSGGYLHGPSSSSSGMSRQNHEQQLMQKNQQHRPPATMRPPSTNVNVESAITRTTQVPLVDSVKLIPPLQEKEIEEMKVWIKNDKEYEGVYKGMQKRMREEITKMGKTRKWWEREYEPQHHAEIGMNGMRRKEQFKIIYPRNGSSRDQQLRDGRRRVGKREGLRFPGRVKIEDTKRMDQLVPIRLEFDVEHYRYRDTFVWNLNDPIVTPEHFAQTVVEDYGLTPNFHSIITKSIQEQLSDYRAHSSLFADVEDSRMQHAEAEIAPLCSGLLEGEDLEWWEKWRKKLRSKRGGVRSSLLDSALDPDPAVAIGHSKKKRKLAASVEKIKPLSVNVTTTSDDVFMDAAFLDEVNLHEEIRILIKLDITVGSVKLDDQFEWDLENGDTTPEKFAEIYSNDLGLVGEFKTAIAHSIREQVHTYQKSLFLVGHPSDGSAVQDEDLKSSFLSPVLSVARMPDQTTAFTPTLNYLSDGELDRIDKERERELNKRRKRNTRGRRGLMLPDREPIKTHRTPAIGFPPIDSSLLAIAAAAAAPTSRRAAAAAATANIAQMVASENGTAIVATTTVPVLPQTSTPIMSKLPKPRGSFKPPSYSSSVLKARAKVVAPTPSTSADASSFEPPLEGDLPLPSIAVPSTPDLRVSKILSARRQRELEKEAKEKEFADGQHANMIDGVWHCSNCGCPDSIAIGRRKGPLGDKSQCGACGKFWHRHRRPRPVDYHTDAEYHLNLKLEAERGKTPAKKRGANRVTNTETREPTPTRASVPPSVEIDQSALLKPNGPPDSKSSRRSRAPSSEPLDRPTSRASSVTSSASERPLAQAVMQVNGVNHKPGSSKDGSRSDEPPAPVPDSQPQPEPTPPSTKTEEPPENSTTSNSEVNAPVVIVAPDPLPPPPASTVVTTPPAPPTRPKWLDDAISEILTRYPDDRIDVIMRRVSPDAPPDWRVKCLDCPGKLYMHGPGETLNGYEVHLRNRQHRARVHARVHGS